MRTPFHTLLLLLVTTFTLSSHAQEAMTPKQAKAAFEKADRALNDAWTEAKKALPEDTFNRLKEDQRAWVEYRDYLARSPMYTGADAQDELATTAPEYLEAAAALEEERTRWLKGLVREWGAEETLTGEWSDSCGGTIQVVEQDGKLYFLMDCVRGPTSHTGGISGVAVWNLSIGWFSDKGRDKEKEDETNLSFLLRDKKLEIHGANTSYYHGARAYFDGDYVKVGTLNAKAKAKVLKAAKTGELPEE